MAKIGTMELFVFLIVAFFAIGPERLPKAARILGRALGRLKKEYTSAKNELLGGVDEFKSVGDDLKSVKKTFQQAMTDAEHGVSKQGDEIQKKIAGRKTKAKATVTDEAATPASETESETPKPAEAERRNDAPAQTASENEKQ